MGREGGISYGRARHRQGRGGHSNGAPQERRIPVGNIERQWKQFLQSLVRTFRFYGIMIGLAHRYANNEFLDSRACANANMISVSSHFTNKGGGTWAIYFAHIAWLQAVVAYIPCFCMGLALEWMRRKRISCIRKSWSKVRVRGSLCALFTHLGFIVVCFERGFGSI